MRIEPGTPLHRIHSAVGGVDADEVRLLAGDLADVCDLDVGEPPDKRVAALAKATLGRRPVEAIMVPVVDVRHLIARLVGVPPSAGSEPAKAETPPVEPPASAETASSVPQPMDPVKRAKKAKK